MRDGAANLIHSNLEKGLPVLGSLSVGVGFIYTIKCIKLSKKYEYISQMTYFVQQLNAINNKLLKILNNIYMVNLISVIIENTC